MSYDIKSVFRSVSHQSPSRLFSPMVFHSSSSDLARHRLVGTENSMSYLGTDYVQPSHPFQLILVLLFIYLQLPP